MVCCGTVVVPLTLSELLISCKMLIYRGIREEKGRLLREAFELVWFSFSQKGRAAAEVTS